MRLKFAPIHCCERIKYALQLQHCRELPPRARCSDLLVMTWQAMPFPTGQVEIELGSASVWLVGAIRNSWYYPRTRLERKYSRA